MTISNGGNLQNITLTKPLIASYNSGKVILKRDGVQAMATKVEIASINDNIANITVAVPNIPFPSNVIHNEVRPQRSNEGIVTNDLNTHYMESRNMRLLKIVHPKAHLTLKNIALRNGGVCDDVTFNPEYTENRQNSGTTPSSHKFNFDIVEEDDMDKTFELKPPVASFHSLVTEFCSRKTVEAANKGRHNGGAVYFSGKSFF